MKVAILVPNFTKASGDARVAEQQARDLSAEGHQVTVFTLSSDLDVPGVIIRNLGMPKHLFWQRIYRLFMPLNVFKTSHWITELADYDEAIAHLYPMTWLASQVKKRHGILYTFWNHGTGNPRYFPSFVDMVYTRIYKYLTKITIKNADRIVSVSNYLREELFKETHKESEVIYNIIDKQRFKSGLDGSAIRTNLNLENRPVVLTVGRISPPKRIHTLIEACQVARLSVPDLRLVIVGKVTYDAYSRQVASMADDFVIFAGSVPDDDLPYYYAMSNVYASCTAWEGFNLPIVEAQYTGLPVVVFDIGPHSEVIDNRGRLIPEGDINAFGQALVECLTPQT